MEAEEETLSAPAPALPPLHASEARDDGAAFEVEAETSEEIDLTALTFEETEPPFDPPDEDDEIFGAGPAQLEGGQDAADGATPEHGAGERAGRRERPAHERPAPAISVHVSWDRPECEALLAAMAADARMARVDLTAEYGGIDAAATYLASRPSPDLLILDTALAAPEMLESLTRLAQVLSSATKVIILGGVNDVPLLRELSRRGISQYMLTPLASDDVVRSVCALFAENDKSRVIAVIGARGGVGASTLAHNIAWSIAERQDVSTSLVELDLAFGTAAFDLELAPARSIADGLVAPGDVDEAFLNDVAIKRGARLQLLAGPAALDRDLDLDPRNVEATIARVRRTSGFVVLDLPHRWNPWVKAALLAADEIVVAATPDLASMRNAKNLLDVLRPLRRGEPLLVLSMVDAPERPEISAKEFAQAVGATPAATFAFDPALFAAAGVRGRAIGEYAPRSKAAGDIDALASLLTGRQIVAHKRPPAPGAQRKPTVAKPAAELRPIAGAEADAPPSFTFKAPTRDVEAALRDDTLVLAHRAPEAASASRSALPAPPARRGRPGTIRAALLVAALVLGAVWFLQSRREAAAAIEHAAPPSHAQNVARTRAALTPDSADVYASAIALLSHGRKAEAVAALTQAAQAGSAKAQYRLAKLYESGDGVQASMATARRWTERAAAGGNRRAMHDLGVYYARGEGGVQDDVTALHWFGEAAAFGVADSQYNLGVLYADGRGADADPVTALTWFLIAGGQSEPKAQARIAALEAQLSPAQQAEARRRAAAFTPKAPYPNANDEPAPSETVQQSQVGPEVLGQRAQREADAHADQ